MYLTNFIQCHVTAMRAVMLLLIAFLSTACGQPDTLTLQTPSYPPPPPQQPAVPIITPVIISPGTVVEWPNSKIATASPDEIAQLALQSVKESYLSPGGNAEIVYSAFASAQELKSLGVPQYDDEPPMVVVIIKGDIDTTVLQKRSQGLGKKKPDYISSVYDLRAGDAITIVPSANGGKFRSILRDPKIKDDPITPPWHQDYY